MEQLKTHRHMDQKLQDGGKSALRVTKQPPETSWPNGWSQQLALLDSRQSLWREYAQEISPSWDHFQGPKILGQKWSKRPIFQNFALKF